MWGRGAGTRRRRWRRRWRGRRLWRCWWHPGLRRVRACASAEGRDGAVCTGGLRVAVGLLLPLGRVDGASWLSHALHEGGQCRVHYALLRHAVLLLRRIHSGLRVQLAGAGAEGLAEEGLWGSTPAMHMQLLGRRDRLHRHCALAVRCRTTLRWCVGAGGRHVPDGWLVPSRPWWRAGGQWRQLLRWRPQHWWRRPHGRR